MASFYIHLQHQNAYVPGLMSFQGKINQNNNNKIGLPANKCVLLIL